MYGLDTVGAVSDSPSAADKLDELLMVVVACNWTELEIGCSAEVEKDNSSCRPLGDIQRLLSSAVGLMKTDRQPTFRDFV